MSDNPEKNNVEMDGWNENDKDHKRARWAHRGVFILVVFLVIGPIAVIVFPYVLKETISCWTPEERNVRIIQSIKAELLHGSSYLKRPLRKKICRNT